MIDSADFNKILVEHDAFAEGFDSIQKAFNQIGNGYPIILGLIGESGTGKSRLLKSFADIYPAMIKEDGLEAPILHVVLPSDPTQKSVAYSLLTALNDPGRKQRLTEYAMTERAVNLINACKVKAIFIDEMQHLIEKRGRGSVRNTADWLKNLVEETKVLLVISGLPDTVALFESNEQLKRRSYGVIRMPRFDWHSATSRAQFIGLLQDFQSKMLDVDMPNLASNEIAFRFWIATEGLTGLVARLLSQTLVNVGERHQSIIRLADFEQTYREINMDFGREIKNPFSNKFDFDEFLNPKVEQITTHMTNKTNVKNSKNRLSKVLCQT